MLCCEKKTNLYYLDNNDPFDKLFVLDYSINIKDICELELPSSVENDSDYEFVELNSNNTNKVMPSYQEKRWKILFIMRKMEPVEFKAALLNIKDDTISIVTSIRKVDCSYEETRETNCEYYVIRSFCKMSAPICFWIELQNILLEKRKLKFIRTDKNDRVFYYLADSFSPDIQSVLDYSIDIKDICDAELPLLPDNDDGSSSYKFCKLTPQNRICVIPKCQRKINWKVLVLMRMEDYSLKEWYKVALLNLDTNKISIYTSTDDWRNISDDGSNAIEPINKLWSIARYHKMSAPISFWKELQYVLYKRKYKESLN